MFIHSLQYVDLNLVKWRITMTTSTQFVAQLQKDNEALFEASKMNVKAYFESKDNSMEALVEHFTGRMVNERMNMVEISRQVANMPADADPIELQNLSKQAMDEAIHFRMVKECIEKITGEELDVAAAMAAEGYFRASGKMGIVLATSGPGAQNLLNGICGCWYESIPCLFITGQVNTHESLDSIISKPRQVGFQETPVTESFKHFVKFSKKITNVDEFDVTLKEGSEMLEE